MTEGILSSGEKGEGIYMQIYILPLRPISFIYIVLLQPSIKVPTTLVLIICLKITNLVSQVLYFLILFLTCDRLCGLVVRVPGSIPDITRFSEKKWVWNGVLSAS
jgi:hypothetical protein